MKIDGVQGYSPHGKEASVEGPRHKREQFLEQKLGGLLEEESHLKERVQEADKTRVKKERLFLAYHFMKMFDQSFIQMQAGMQRVDAQLKAYVWNNDDWRNDPNKWGCAFTRVDILNWPYFIESLKQASASTQMTPLKRIWETMTPESQRVIKEMERDRLPDKNAQEMIINGLNEAIKKRDLYQPEIFQGVSLNEEAQKLLKTLNAAHPDTLPPDGVGRFNRLLLEALYPPEVILRGWTIEPEGQYQFYQGAPTGVWTWGRLKENIDLPLQTAREMLWILDHPEIENVKEWWKNYDPSFFFEAYKRISSDRDLENKASFKYF